MSGVLKGIRKVFKKVGNFVKKIALPVLAIGAVVLTGGAALGALPALGTTLGSLGLGATATGVLTAAAQGATIGALGSAVTGGNIIKGATSGFLAGGLTGGIGAIAGGAGGAAGAAGSAAGGLPGTASGTLTSTLVGPGAGAALHTGSALGGSLGGAASGIGSVAAGGAGGLASTLGASPSFSPVLNTTMPTGGVPAGGGGIGSIFRGMDPMMKGQLISGIGQGLLANEQLKAQRRAQREERDRIEASYANMDDSLFRLGAPSNTGQDPNSRFNAPVYGKVQYDPQTGRIIPKGS